MELKFLLLLIFIIILIVIVVRYIMKDVNTLSGVVSAKTMQTISASSLASSSSGGNSSNYTYSVWFYVDDWNYRYGEPKVIFGRMTSGTGSKEPCPSVVLAPAENNIIISLAVYPGLDEQPTEGENYIIHNCPIANIPIQKWCNLLMSVYGRTMDLYLDGKLVRTCILPGVAKVDNDSNVYVTPNGGFAGWTSNLQYWPNATDPQKAWDIYTKGYGGSWLGNLFGSYSVKVTVMENDVESTSFTI